MEQTPDVLDLDALQPVPVMLARRPFTLALSSRPAIMRVLKFVNSGGESEGKKVKEEAEATEVIEAQFENSLPLIAVMLGFEKKDEAAKEAIEFLREHLSPAQALKIFAAWWKLNEVDDFFIRRGNVLMDPDIAQWMKTQRKAIAQEVSSIPATPTS